MKIICCLLIGFCANIKDTLGTIPKYEQKPIDGIFYKQGMFLPMIISCEMCIYLYLTESSLGNKNSIQFYTFN